MSKPYNYHKLARQTGFVKKPNARCLRKQWIEQKNAEYSRVEYGYTVLNKEGGIDHVVKSTDFHFGIFPKKGYKPSRLFTTREEAEQEFSTWSKNSQLRYEIREILDWGEQ